MTVLQITPIIEGKRASKPLVRAPLDDRAAIELKESIERFAKATSREADVELIPVVICGNAEDLLERAFFQNRLTNAA